MVNFNFILVRHGTTEWIEANKIQGATDSPLSKKGRQEAAWTAQALKAINFDGFFCSPIGRTVETAQIIGKEIGKAPIVIDALREMNFGIYEGKTYFDTPASAMHWWKKISLLTRILISQVTGESIRSVRSRAVQSCNEIKKICPNGQILIISHGVILNYLIGCLLPKEKYDKIKPIHLQPCSMTEIGISASGRVELIRLNDLSHLSRKNS